APWVGMLQNDVWLKYARQANAIAQKLHDGLAQLNGVKILFPRQANSVFAELPEEVIRGMWDRGWMFYTFIGRGGCRFMCSWDTTEQDVQDFVSDLKSLLSGAR
ncbi:MAG: threonine aldolase, partial [Limisphaerales bacterium]